ncbi:ATP-grasp domain-containing protein [Nocardiopsis sp. CNR-923]|uniref:ATP-grasp domain-containing protein n=1 Tax=Nocardiopsis sp. CNR-923 TaxID=1904965 RepID=UPI00130186D0|nr:ATP-grasp domain-containing protein [Nocardiopsis sp. CNR-923]
MVIVDAYSTGRLLTHELAGRGAHLIHVQSSPRIPEFYRRTFDPDGFALDLGHDPSFAALVRTLKELEIDAIAPGTETGVRSAEQLAVALGLAHNSQTAPESRWDKEAMAAALRDAGLGAPDGLRVGSEAQAVEWYRAGGGGRVVVKPAMSAGSDGVRLCHDERSVAEAVGAVLSSESNLLGRTNAEAVVQELLTGPEYYVNTISADGRHQILEAWRYHKKRVAGSPIYDYDVPVDLSSDIGRTLCDYVRRALTALGVHHGPAHAEVIITREGPKLIDIGARPAGCADFPAGIAPDRVGQVEATASWLMDPASVHDLSIPSAPCTGIELRRVAMINGRRAPMTSLAWVDVLRELPTAAMVCPRAAQGDLLEATRDLATSPGFLYLAGTGDEVERDYRRLRALEGRHLYTEQQTAG